MFQPEYEPEALTRPHKMMRFIPQTLGLTPVLKTQHSQDGMFGLCCGKKCTDLPIGMFHYFEQVWSEQ